MTDRPAYVFSPNFITPLSVYLARGKMLWWNVVPQVSANWQGTLLSWPGDLQPNNFIIPFNGRVMLSVSPPIIEPPHLSKSYMGGGGLYTLNTTVSLKRRGAQPEKTVIWALTQLYLGNYTATFKSPALTKHFKRHWREVVLWFRVELRTRRTDLKVEVD